MHHATPPLLLFGLLLVASLSAWSKGPTARISIEGEGLDSAIVIDDPEITSEFNIWNGPGVSTSTRGVPDPPAHLNPELAAGRFIDWPRGKVDERPAGLRRYLVSFHIGGGGSQPDIVGTYEVIYETADSGEGYMYLPENKERPRNTSFIYHGVEGHWFRSSQRWEELVRPIIESERRPRAAMADALLP